MPDELLPVATFVRPSEAAAAKTALEAEGILCFFKDENIISMDWLLGNAVGYVKLLVPAADVERARALLDAPFHWPAEVAPTTRKCQQCGEEIDVGLSHCGQCGAPRQSPDADKDEAAFVERLRNESERQKRQETNPYLAPQSGESTAEQDAFDRPVGALCPGCGRGRVAICPYCRTTGSNFAPADTISIDASAGEPPLVICPTCDEPFPPQYLRRCEWCGHDFGTGAEPPQIVRPSEREPVNWRVGVASILGIAVIAAIIAYFAILLK